MQKIFYKSDRMWDDYLSSIDHYHNIARAKLISFIKNTFYQNFIIPDILEVHFGN